jgi:hypothetical protein
VYKSFDKAKSEAQKFVDLAFYCLQLDPVQRPTAKEILDFLRGKIKNLGTVRSIILKENELMDISIRNKEAKNFWDSNWKDVCFSFFTQETIC